MRAIDTNVLVRLITRDDFPQVPPDIFPFGTFDQKLAKVEGTQKL